MNYSNVSFTYTPENMTAILKDFLSSYSNGFHHSIKKIVWNLRGVQELPVLIKP